MTVEVLAGPTHGGTRIGVAGGDLNVPQVNARVKTGIVVTKVWRSICGCGLVIGTPAASASRRSRRVAAWRSILAPRLLRRIGPLVRVFMDRSMARPTAGGSGMSTTLEPLPQTRSTR
jgi:hypothetical protein